MLNSIIQLFLVYLLGIVYIDMTRNVGRPKDDLSLLPDNWYNEILSMYREGCSDVEVKALIFEWRGSFSNDLWDRWIKEEEQFSETIKAGKLMSEAWWHKEGRTSLREKEFNYTGWYMQMKNRFGWADKQELDHTTKGDKIQTIVREIVKTDN